MKTILAPIDFSRVSRDVIREAVDLARIVKARVVILHAVQPPPIVTDLAPLAGEALQLTAEIERGARRSLQRLQRALQSRRVTVETLCLQGAPVALIAATAEQLGARYIVIGSHGHTALYDLVAGSTASGVLKHASCPVVVVSATRKPAARRRKPVARR